MTYKKSILIDKKKDILFEIKIIKEQIIILNKIFWNKKQKYLQIDFKILLAFIYKSKLFHNIIYLFTKCFIISNNKWKITNNKVLCIYGICIKSGIGITSWITKYIRKI